MNLSMIDVAFIAIYLIGVTAFRIRTGCRKHTNPEQYFLAGGGAKEGIVKRLLMPAMNAEQVAKACWLWWAFPPFC